MKVSLHCLWWLSCPEPPPLPVVPPDMLQLPGGPGSVASRAWSREPLRAEDFERNPRPGLLGVIAMDRRRRAGSAASGAVPVAASPRPGRTSALGHSTLMVISGGRWSVLVT